ncbi:UNKNOWN [Stylonychia lemnae]|uniref:Uncharacterized protein n=1 Tax=Stylonychia lemnae TaxID=5949 RepID=A0A077ZTJ3_STYLE|nr:UNKNOWN [Stylonychia lemnae]|eukprot:CDW71781.1 UNKNOWN [Stylonychia lemnae]
MNSSSATQPDEILGNSEAPHVMKDKRTSGRLEANIYLNTKNDSGEEGTLVHSKQSSKKYISQDYETFIALIGETLGKA